MLTMKNPKLISLLLIEILITTLPAPVRAQGSTPQMMAASQLTIMPVPASVQMQTGRLPITNNFQVAVTNFSDDRLRRGLARMVTRLAGRTVLSLPSDLAADAGTATLVIQCERAGETVPSLNENESYSLDVTDKQARLVAPTVVGALRGLETFLQLLQGDRAGFYLPAIRIQDQPSFPWRGLLLDGGRHYDAMELLKRNLEDMAPLA